MVLITRSRVIHCSVYFKARPGVCERSLRGWRDKKGCSNRLEFRRDLRKLTFGCAEKGANKRVEDATVEANRTSYDSVSRQAIKAASLICLSLHVPFLCALAVNAQVRPETPMGIVWQVQGVWRLANDGTALASGGSIPARALLQATEDFSAHSITLLLPDGQRILYECFTPTDCARGFRVPALYRKPDPFAVDMLERIRAVLIGKPDELQFVRNQSRELAWDATVRVIGPDNQVEVAGLAARLSSGHYTGDLRRLDPGYPRHLQIAIEKKGPSIALSLPGPGLYDLKITDNLNMPRVDIWIGAVSPALAASVTEPFGKATTLLQDWNENYQGWPVQQFRRAYLAALMLDVKPAHQDAARQSTARNLTHRDITAEPAYSPKPGVFSGDTAVTLGCDTPGAVIHYTVDNSQPMEDSPVYSAPIMVKGTELTIKAFASTPGRKDSPVVTGIFRIKE